MESHDIRFVLHEGDVVDGDGMDLHQWDIAKSAMDNLNGIVPYVIAPGNHDYEGNAVTRFSYFNDDLYFGPSSPYATQETIAGFFEDNKTENSYHIFEVEGVNWLVVALMFGPPDEVVDWADDVISNHPNHSVILLTHAYMYSDDTRYNWVERGSSQGGNPHAYSIARSPSETVNDGQQLWEKLVDGNPNVKLVFSGHVTNRGVGFQTSVGDGGHVVQQMLFNYQTGVYGSTNGGNGFLRLIEISPNGTVSVRTYSPYADKFLTSPLQQLVIEIKPQPVVEGPDLSSLLDSAEASIDALGSWGFDLGDMFDKAVDDLGEAGMLVDKGYINTAEWILDVRVRPVLEGLGEIPLLLSSANTTISKAQNEGVDSITIGSLQGCLVSAKHCLDDSDLGGAKEHLNQITERSVWQDTPSMLSLAQQIIGELEEAGDRKVFMAKGDYDRALRALSGCDHSTAHEYLGKILAIGEVPPIASLSMWILAIGLQIKRWYLLGRL